MRQVVSLIKDNQAHFALVDDEDGSMIPFADVLIPDPERFGLHESAMLGTNLINVLGLNGTKRPKAQNISLANVPPTHRGAPEPEALPAAPPTETAQQRKLRLDRERWHARKDKVRARPRAAPKPKGMGAGRYVELDEVLAIIAQFPEGLRQKELAAILWRTTDGKGTDDESAPKWMYQAVGNRLLNEEHRAKKGKVVLPYRIEMRPLLNADGMWNGAEVKHYVPNQRPADESA